MKEADLFASESKNIVIGSFMMCAEGLDIPTLCRLVMITPKVDVEQTVGRILRSNHAMPIVVDIVDTHSVFERQWTKRKAFYRKEKYAIIKTTSTNYTPDISKWQTIFTPKFDSEPTNNKRTVVSAKVKPENEIADEDEEEPVVKKSCTIDLSMFA